MLNKSHSSLAKPQATMKSYDWLKESRISCPSCRGSYVMPVKRSWYQKIATRQKKFWCQDCGTFFWRKD